MKHHVFMYMEIDPNDPPVDGPFYVIEKFHEPAFVTHENGELKTFNTYPQAAEEAADCQDGYVISFN